MTKAGRTAAFARAIHGWLWELSRGGVLTAPNLISLTRFPLAAGFVMVESSWARGGILAVGALTDWLDGLVARRRGGESRLGELLDPVADKTLLVVALVTFHLEGLIPAWELMVILVRDIYTVPAFLIAQLVRPGTAFRARPSGKLVTVLQVATALILLAMPRLGTPLAVATGIAGVVASADYTVSGLRRLRGSPPAL